MPVSFPPEFLVAGDTLQPEMDVAIARSKGGLIVTSRDSDPYWAGRLTTPAMASWADGNARERLLTWIYWAIDCNMRVDLVHPKHRLPSTYVNGGWPMIGDGALDAIPDLRTIRVSGVPAGVQLLRSDRLAIYQGNIIVHRWVAEDTLVTSEISQVIQVTPRLPLGVLAPGAIVALEDPKMRFMIVPGSVMGEDATAPSPVSFEVMEALR